MLRAEASGHAHRTADSDLHTLDSLTLPPTAAPLVTLANDMAPTSAPKPLPRALFDHPKLLTIATSTDSAALALPTASA